MRVVAFGILTDVVFFATFVAFLATGLTGKSKVSILG
jgi:hypothetical protein